MECKLCELGEVIKPVSGTRMTTLDVSKPIDVVIVGDFPHEEDVIYKKPFAGKQGVILAKILQTVGMNPLNIYLTTLVKCRPIGENHLDGRMKKAHVTACSMYLMEELAEIQPKLLILMGDSVFKYFHPDKTFSDFRGKILTHEDTGIATITTYHIMSMLASSKLDELIYTDFQTASDYLYGKKATVKPTKDYKFVTHDRKDPIEFLKKIVERTKTAEMLSFDIETHGKGYFDYKLLSIGMSWKEHTGISIPVWVRDEAKVAALERIRNFEPEEHYKVEKVTLKSGKIKEKKTKISGLISADFIAMSNILPDEYWYVLNHENLTQIRAEITQILDKNPPLMKYWGKDHDLVIGLIKEIMENDAPKVAHNGSYDVNRLRGLGINVKNWAFDTIIMHHMIDEERPHGLDDLSYVYTKDGGYKSEKNVYLASSQTSWANIPMTVLLPYNAQDADVTLQLYHIFKDKLISNKKRWNLLLKLVMPAQRMLTDMSFRGSDIDLSWVKKTKDGYLKKMHDLKIEFQQIVGKVVPNCYVIDDPEEEKASRKEIRESAKEQGIEPVYPNYFNMNSNKQLIELFVDYYKAPLTKKTKSGVALDSDVLAKLQKKFPAAGVLLEYKALKKLESTYLTGLVDEIDSDGKIHTEYKLFGTVTSRLASSTPNLQNVPGSMKPMFVPPKGYVCVNVDQSAAELHVLAWMALDKKMMDIFENRRDLHRETAAGVFNKKPEDISDAERKIAKRCFSSDSFILTEDGYIRGKDIGSRQVYTLDGKLQNQHHVFEERDGLKITLRNGMQLKVTNDHKFQDFTHLTPTWKEANQFKVGDVIGFLKNVPTPTDYVILHNDVKLKTHTKRYPEYIPLDEDFAYLIGCLLSDGSVHNQYKHCLASHVELIGKYEQQSKFNGAFGTKFGINVHAVKGKYTHYGISSVELAHLLDRLCGRRKEKHIPDELFRSPKSVVDSFISGMIDGDGNTTKGVVHFDNTNERLVDGLCELATLYGYAVTKRQEEYRARIRMNKNQDKVYNGICYTCTFVSKPDLTLAIKHKAEGFAKKSGTTPFVNTWPILLPEVKTLKGKSHDISYLNYNMGRQKGLPDAFVTRWNLPHKEYWSSEIKSIKPVKFEALIMETDTHFFIGEGLSSHNCSFGTAYGISGKGLADLLEPEGVKISESQGNRFIKKWRETYPACARFLDKSSKDFARYGKLETPFGRIRHKYKKFLSEEKEAASARQACNFPIQSTASDIQLYEMVTMYQTLLDNGVLPVFTVHDSIVMYCPVEKLEWLRDFYREKTCRRFSNEEFPGLNNCLMYTEMEVGRNYGEHIKLPYDCDFKEWKEQNHEIFNR